MQSFKLLTRNNEYSQKIYKIANNYQMPDKDIGFLFKSENNVISLSLFFSIIINTKRKFSTCIDIMLVCA